MQLFLLQNYIPCLFYSIWEYPPPAGRGPLHARLPGASLSSRGRSGTPGLAPCTSTSILISSLDKDAHPGLLPHAYYVHFHFPRSPTLLLSDVDDNGLEDSTIAGRICDFAITLSRVPCSREQRGLMEIPP